MRTIGPRQITERARSSPTAKKQGRRRRSRASQLLATTSGPTPAGSPSATASGGRARASTVLPIVDNRVAAKVAQIGLGDPRSEGRRDGQKSISTCSPRGAANPQKKTTQNK